jgi:hypothetical protein
MPAKKPADLIVRDETKADRQLREEQANALTPSRELGVWVPVEVVGARARSTWRETIRLYKTLDARIASVLDKGLLIDYCNVSEQLSEIDDLRTAAMNNYTISQELYNGLRDKESDEVDVKMLVRLQEAINKCLDEILKLDSRADNKRKLLHSYRQSLLLTPRSRGGVNPEGKPKEEPQSEMSRLLDGEAKPEKGKKKAVKHV